MQKPITSQGNPLENKDIYETLFAFMDDALYHYKPSITAKGEDDITQDLEISLRERTRNTCFDFQNQHKEGNTKTDIGVFIKSNRYFFCWIEAKVLPTPNGGKNRDEREYVFVDKNIKNKNNKRQFDGNGGIQRFKESKHAPTLTHSIMIGYIQDENSTDYWLSKINAWIKELANTENYFWSNKDSLVKNISDKCDRFVSTHIRKDAKAIELHHYWIKC